MAAGSTAPGRKKASVLRDRLWTIRRRRRLSQYTAHRVRKYSAVPLRLLLQAAAFGYTDPAVCTLPDNVGRTACITQSGGHPLRSHRQLPGEGLLLLTAAIASKGGSLKEGAAEDHVLFVAFAE